MGVIRDNSYFKSACKAQPQNQDLSLKVQELELEVKKRDDALAKILALAMESSSKGEPVKVESLMTLLIK